MADTSVDDIRARMARIRTRAHRKASKLGEETRQFLDWKHYVRLFPWGTLGVAAVVGYWLVPKKKAVTASDAKAIAELAKSGRINLNTSIPAPKKSTILGSAIGVLSGFALKAASSYATQYLSRMLTESMAGRIPPHAGSQPGFQPPYASQEVRTHEPAEPLA